ncbi:hypothetical protein FD733_01155 [Pantoea sp. Eser]|nr:hypothetical protein [Pantoea sp. Eser]
MPVENICVIGLGSMSMGAAQSCIRASLNTWGVDLNPAALETLRQAGTRDAQSSAARFADQLDAVLLLVVNAQQVNAILFGDDGRAAKLRPGTAVMVSSTLSAQDAQQIEQRLAKHQLLMLDAPVSGGAAKAASGEMTVMASGSEAAFTQLQPVLDAVAAKVYRVGSDIGLGSTVKIIHQLLAGVHIAVGAEAMALAALAWLQQQGCERFYFKYCSTFDSTTQGNIGPVTDALLAALGESLTVICPALPVNGRTFYQGHLFVGDRLLSDSGMRHHPVTPIHDSNLLRLMEAQATGQAGLIAAAQVDRGTEAVRQALGDLAEQGINYTVIDTLNELHLLT